MSNESNSRSNVFQISRASACVSSRWKVLSGEFRRRPTALAIKFCKPDRVGRRGLSEPREDFSRLPTVANQILARTFFRSVAHPLACPVDGNASIVTAPESVDKEKRPIDLADMRRYLLVKSKTSPPRLRPTDPTRY